MSKKNVERYPGEYCCANCKNKSCPANVKNKGKGEIPRTFRPFLGTNICRGYKEPW